MAPGPDAVSGPGATPGGEADGRPSTSARSAAAAADADGTPVARQPPPLPVRGASSSSDGAPGFALPVLSPEQLAADQPSLDMLRRVRRGLRALPEPD